MTIREFFGRSAYALLFGAVICAGARAETLIYVTANTIGSVDSAAPATDNTSGANGPMSFTLPSGYAPVGGQVSADDQFLYLLASNGTTCQLYQVDTEAIGGNAGVTAFNSSYACSYAQGTGDISFFDGTGASGITDEYLVADANAVDEVPAGGGAPASIAFAGGNLMGIAQDSTDSAQYGVDGSLGALVQLDLQTGAETVESDLGITLSGSTSLDYSPLSQTFYLFTNGSLYAASSPQSAFSALGSAPSGSILVVAADNAAVSNNTSAGAFVPASMLPLLALAAVRRARRKWAGRT
jgi:hypothetical protein